MASSMCVSNASSIYMKSDADSHTQFSNTLCVPDKDDVCLCNVLVHICAEEQVATTSLLHDCIQSWLVNR